MNTKKLTQLAMLTGIALIIFVIELQIPNPFPIPGIKLGLANVITVYAIYHYRPSEVMMIVFCRIFLAAVFSGNMMALAYSFAGSVLCLTGILLLRKLIDINWNVIIKIEFPRARRNGKIKKTQEVSTWERNTVWKSGKRR